jgi:hypothetical protein
VAGLLVAIPKGLLWLMDLQDFAGKHAGETAFVIGSGKSLDFYDASFFADRLTIGINHGWAEKLDRVDYMVTKYHSGAHDWVGSDRVGVVVVTKHDRGHLYLETLQDNRMLVVDHNDNTMEAWGGEWPDSGLVATHSSITTGMHLAAVLGVKSIVMVGADCGTFDDETNRDGYGVSRNDNQKQVPWFRGFDRQNVIVANILRERYGINVVSLLPFVTPNMEGHRFESHAGVLNA